MYYIYVLQSEKDNNFYVGYTANLKEQIKEHNKGRVESTKKRIPLKIIYYEACLEKQDALKREKYLKSNYGKRYIKNRFREYLN